MKKLLLIDGHSILSRAFYGVPILTSSTGIHTNAVYGFLNIMFKCIEEENAQYIAVAFDQSRQKLKRTALYPAYKGTRKPMPEELLEQVPIMQDLISAMNIPILTMEGYEADDLLGTVAKKSQAAGYEVTIVSGDRDLLQLCDEHIKISMPKTSRGQTEIFNYYPEDVLRQYKVTPKEFIDLKALMGDSSDNIPGLPGVGEKTATDIIVKYKSIENAREHASEVKPPRAQKALTEHF
ncbi:MAG: 5'-3' exonuclease H3TH domain-containing protein, partial [Eubacteriales bacterium]|nr:5'-3' exonuclease H3TH domain-containing protein [Eubacteriales bacterium]